MQVALHPEARAELRSAALWYEEWRDGLGHEFVAAITAAIQKIGDEPRLFPRWPDTEHAPTVIRKVPVERFPYVIAFEEHEDYALVLAVGHQKRRPLYWLRRSGQEGT